jgi:transposase
VNYYAAIDVSLELSSVCIVDATGKVVKEAKVETHPEALVKFFRAFGLPLTVIGLEAGPLSQWLYRALTEAGFVTTLLETRHVKAALSAMTVKTDRRDARGMAQLLRMGWFRPVHAKSPENQEVRALLVARKQLQHKLTDIELSIRGILRGFGLKVGKVTDKAYEARIRKLVTGHAMLEQIAEAMLAARATLLEQFNKLHKAVLDIARKDEVCRRLMTTPSVGAIVAITYKSALDDPGRINKSRNAGPLFGLTPRRYQSGETDVTGGISRVGDAMVRTALYEAANVLLSRVTRFSALKRWGLEVAKRRGMKRAKVAVARKLAVILHRMWIDGSTFRWTKEQVAHA